MKSISVFELMRRLNEDGSTFLLDVREPQEVAQGAIPGSINIPLDEVLDRVGELPTGRDIVVICHLGIRSAHVTQKLNALGYDRAVNLEGGVDDWLRGHASGHPK